MADLSNIQNKLVYKARIDSVTHQLPTDFRNMGIVPTLIALATRFGANNRALIRSSGIGRS
jgi:hypothetical protein